MIRANGELKFGKGNKYGGRRKNQKQINGRKETDEALRETSQYLENLFNYANVPIFVWDPQFKIIRFNHAFETLIGRSARDVIGKSVKILFPADKAESSMEFIRGAAEGKRWEAVEIAILHFDGTVRAVLWNSANIYVKDKKIPIATIAQGIDITARKEAREALEFEKKRLYSALDSINACVVIEDQEFNIQFENKVTRKTFGGNVGRKCYKSYIGRETPCDICPIKAILHGDKMEFTYYPEAAGKIFESHAAKFENPDGALSIIEVFIDITMSKKAEEEIRRAAEEWRRTFDSVTDLIFLQDKDFTITRGNKAFAEALKSNPEDIVGKKCYELLHKMDKPWPGCPFEMMKKDKKAHTQEVDDPGIGIPLLVTTSPVFGGDGELLASVHVAKNIFEIKQNEKKLKETQVQLVQASKLATLGEMSAGLAHEINQPLSGITLTARSLRKLVDRGSLTREELKSALEDIDASIKRITKIIEHIRTFARQDDFKFIQVDVRKPVENALSLLGEQLRLHEIEVIKEYSDSLPKVQGEPYQLEQVIINIISNARDALNEKGRKNEKGYLKKLIIKTEKIKEEACISISDNGAGMAEEVKEKVFQPFFTTKEEGKATGLGMSISYGIIESHKGRIELESEKDKGTTVKVFLPIGTVPEN